MPWAMHMLWSNQSTVLTSSWQRSITTYTNDYKIFVYFIPFISHNQHHLEHFHDATYVPNNQNELLPLAQARVHMHWQEDNSHPASPRILTRKSQTKKEKEILNKSVCISIWTRRIPHARANTKLGRARLLPFYSSRFQIFLC